MTKNRLFFYAGKSRNTKFVCCVFKHEATCIDFLVRPHVTRIGLFSAIAPWSTCFIQYLLYYTLWYVLFSSYNTISYIHRHTERGGRRPFAPHILWHFAKNFTKILYFFLNIRPPPLSFSVRPCVCGISLGVSDVSIKNIHMYYNTFFK